MSIHIYCHLCGYKETHPDKPASPLGEMYFTACKACGYVLAWPNFDCPGVKPIYVNQPQTRGCFNRSADNLKRPVLAPDGFNERGQKQYQIVQTAWKDADKGLCQYGMTAEALTDRGCDGCKWRTSQ